MADETKAAAADTKAKAAAAEQSEKAEKENELVKMQHEFHGNWTLSIGESHYSVQDGAVEVPPWHVGAAHQAGFRPV